jgi:hypothetical protein
VVGGAGLAAGDWVWDDFDADHGVSFSFFFLFLFVSLGSLLACFMLEDFADSVLFFPSFHGIGASIARLR